MSSEQRQLAAIMFTDMVGYSAMAQRDEGLALELLEEHRGIVREILARFHGTEIKTIGDAFLLQFRSALETVQCALEVQRAKRAVQLEPLSAELNTLLGIVYFYAKRYDLASEQFNKTIEFEPNFWWARTFLARTYEKSSKLPAAIAELERAKLMEGATIEVLAALGHAYAASGKRDEALKIISDLKGPANLIQLDGYEIAVIDAALGEKDQAFAYLEKEYATGGWYLNFVKVDPYLDPLRGDPRFKEMLKRLNLPE